MPPKPWETRKKPVENISQIIASNPTVKEETPKLPPSQINPLDKTINSTMNSTTSAAGTGLTSATSGLNSYGGLGGYSSYGGGYGSGSYGGYGGGYGGYGGYSSMGMGSMGYGGMYGMGRYGLMNGQQQKGVLFNTMITLDSFSYLINCLCEIARSLDQNAQGLSLFYKSFKNLISRMQNGVINGCMWVVRKIKNFFLAIFNFIVENIFFMGQKKLKTKYKAIKAIITLSIIVLAVSFYPLIRKAMKNY